MGPLILTHHIYRDATSILAEGPTAATWHHNGLVDDVLVVTAKSVSYTHLTLPTKRIV